MVVGEYEPRAVYKRCNVVGNGPDSVLETSGAIYVLGYVSIWKVFLAAWDLCGYPRRSSVSIGAFFYINPHVTPADNSNLLGDGPGGDDGGSDGVGDVGDGGYDGGAGGNGDDGVVDGFVGSVVVVMVVMVIVLVVVMVVVMVVLVVVVMMVMGVLVVVVLVVW